MQNEAILFQISQLTNYTNFNVKKKFHTSQQTQKKASVTKKKKML